MLVDPCPMIRVIAVLGVCKIMSGYWDMIPGRVIKNILLELVQKLARDSSSADVRGAVLEVQTKYLLNNNYIYLYLSYL